MNLCRVCLEIPKIRIELNQIYRKKFFHITLIEINDSDDGFLCDKCLNRLNAAWDFRQEAKNADDWFKNQPDIIVKELSPEREFSPIKESNDSVKDEDSSENEEESTDEIPEPVKKPKSSYPCHPPEDPDYKPTCGDLRYIDRHERPDGPYICHYCNEQFRTYSLIRTHLRQHKKQLKLTCRYCGEKQENVDKRCYHEKRHRVKQLSTGVFVCDICGTSKPTRFQFARHMIHHRKDTKHSCTIKGCEEGFRDKRSLYKHINKAHGIAYPCICEDCGKKYRHWHTLRSHQRQVHNVDAKEHLKCQECGKNCLTEKKLNEHIAIVHRGERNFRCLLCTSTYTNKAHLMRHYKSNHDGQWENLVKEGKLNAPLSVR